MVLALSCTVCSFALGENKSQEKNRQETEVLPDIVVTASRFEKDAFMLPYTTETVTQEQMIQRNSRTIPEALDQTPGVMIQKTAHGHGSPYVRGFTGRQNLLMLDGVRLNNSTWRSGPTQYWNTVDSFSAAKLELVKSQGSVLYGSDAIGGALNVLSQDSGMENQENGKAFFTGSTMYRYESNGNTNAGRFEANTGVGGEYGIHLGVTDKQFGNIKSGDHSIPWTGYDEYGYDARADWNINSKNTLTIASRYLYQDDVWRTHKTKWAPSWHGTTVESADDFHYDQRVNMDYIKLSGKDLQGGVNAYSLVFSFANSKETELNGTRGKSTTISTTSVNTYGVSLQLESNLPLGKLVYGTDYYYDDVNSTRTKNGLDTAPALPDGSDYQVWGLFSEYIVPLDQEKWELHAGARYTHAKASLEESAFSANEAFSSDWDNLVLSGRAIRKVTDTFNLYAGISQAFRAPNLDDLGANGIPAQTNTFVNGNPDLKPEKYLTYEVGMHYLEKKYSGELSFFFTQVDDMIIQKPIATTGGKTVSVATNASDGWVYGVEGRGQVELAPQWTLSAEGGWIYGEVDEYPSSSNPDYSRSNYISRTPPLMGSLGLRWTAPSDKVWTELRVFAANKADKLNASDVRDTSRIPPGGTPGYYCLSLYAGWRITESLEWTVALENFTDQEYRIHGSGLNEPGIGFVSSIRYSW